MSFGTDSSATMVPIRPLRWYRFVRYDGTDCSAIVVPIRRYCQLCIVHQIRNSVKYIGSKKQKEFLQDLKLVYAASTKEAAELELDNLEAKWGEDYPIVIKSWRDKWENLSHYFNYTAAIRRIIYTTNIVEGYHRQIRKVTKTKGVFPNDDAIYKLVYLAYRNIKKKWTMPIPNWGQTAQQLAIAFGERFTLI